MLGRITEALIPTLIHVAELIVVLLVVWGASYLFPFVANNQVVTVLVLASLTKFGRALGTVPGYVNGR